MNAIEVTILSIIIMIGLGYFLKRIDFLSEKDKPVGRGMDFLVQEMFREITTLGNKAGSGPVAAIVVKFKTELEKIREQIQNIE